MTVALDITVTDDLKVEGDARRIVKQIQTLRKSSGFDITDRISVVLSECDETRKVIDRFGSHIASQVLANSITFGDVTGGVDVDLETFKLSLKIEKA